MTYKAKRAIQGGDMYGAWREGVQVASERINGRTLSYNARKGEWNGKARNGVA
jgi:hypothetical protein